MALVYRLLTFVPVIYVLASLTLSAWAVGGPCPPEPEGC